ncbi:hypothetical protein LFL96_21115 [Paraburkholderia sp. D15]|uniref:hypothetical protein n=1 Tax=Paraburkholderia sp. D15 TaxID=2880218 RepID=UPI002479CC69|nr:hypothetical protein [Paraburkholderia sp. D15]WGS53562.1 hypothetical protein LFL96_21115 [Paraburkholderia sp. D15]
MDDLSESQRAMLFEWTRSAIDAAAYAGLIVPPWRPTEHAYGVLHGYYTAGLTPDEAAQAMFGTHH